MGLLIKDTVDEDLPVWKDQMDKNFQVMDTALGYTQDLSWKGVWAVTTVYKVGDVVRHPTTVWTYRCLVAHTSGAGTFSAEQVANPTYWQPGPINPQPQQSNDLWGEYISDGVSSDFTLLNIFEPGYNYRLQFDSRYDNGLGSQVGIYSKIALGASGLFTNYVTSFYRYSLDYNGADFTFFQDETDAETHIRAAYFANTIVGNMDLRIYNPAEAGATVIIYEATATRFLTAYGSGARGSISYSAAAGALTDFHAFQSAQSDVPLTVVNSSHATLWRYKI